MCGIGLETYTLTNPFGALSGNGLLRQLISQSHFKFRTLQAPFPIQLWNVELPFLLWRFLL